MENLFYGLSKVGSTKISMATIKTKFKIVVQKMAGS